MKLSELLLNVTVVWKQVGKLLNKKEIEQEELRDSNLNASDAKLS